MKKTKTTIGKHKEDGVQCHDLVELLLEPLSSQIDQARLEILEKIQKVLESTEMMARQMARQAKSGE
jgi:hypothetical protein